MNEIRGVNVTNPTFKEGFEELNKAEILLKHLSRDLHLRQSLSVIRTLIVSSKLEPTHFFDTVTDRIPKDVGK